MSINIELRMKDATDFSSQLIYPRAHWQHLDGIPASFNPASHTHDIGSVVNLSTTLANMQDDIDGKATSSHSHDDRYFTETEIANNAIYMRRLMLNANGVPTNNLGTPTVAEMALFQEQFDNKTEFYPISSLTFETFDGTTWTDITSTISDTNKKRFLGGDSSAGIVIPNGVVKYRITVRNTVSYVYLNALYMYWSGSGNSTTVHIWRKRDDGDWIQHTSSGTAVSSWPGHMFLPFGTIPWLPSGGTTHSHLVRIEFTPNWSHATNGIYLYKMQWWGGYPAGKRTIYSVNEDKVVTFPNTIRIGSNNVIIEGDSRLTNARPASDVYSWAKASSKPSYSAAEVGAAAEVHTHPYDNYGGFQFSADGMNYTTIGSNEGLDLLFNNLDFNVAGGDSNLGQGNGAGLQISILEERIQDIVGAMFSGNTETRVSATYQDADGTIELVVDDMTYTLTKAAVEAVLTGAITSHSHAYDNYDHWELSVGGQAGGASREQRSGMLLTLTAGNNIDLYYDDIGNQVYVSFYHEGEVDIASGDHLMIADNSDSNKLKRSDITFGTDDGTFLARDGNFKSALKKTTLLSTAFSFSTTSVAKTMPSSITGKTIYVSWSLNSDYNECYVSAFQFHSHDNTPVYGFATYYSGYPIQGYNWRLVSTSSTNLSFSTGQSWYITPSGSYTSMGNSAQTIYIKEIYTCE